MTLLAPTSPDVDAADGDANGRARSHPQVVPGPTRPWSVPGTRTRGGRHLASVEIQRRSAAVPAIVGVGIVVSALLGLAVMHALLIGGQIRLDDLHRDVAAESEEVRRLELRVAELEAPQRVLEVARARLGMVQPDEVGYLLPGPVRSDTNPVRVPPAEEPPPPRVATSDSVDAEQGAEDAATAGRAAAAAADADTQPTTSDDDVRDETTPGPADDRPDEGGRDE